MNETQKSQIVSEISQKYDFLENAEVQRTFDYALADYLFYKYPVENNRPSKDDFVIDFMAEQWIKQRMEDILSRGGGLNLDAYSENGIDFKYASSHIDPSLVAKLVPKAGVPR